ncbi:unnamed protein product [Clonostachys rosea f. rosea IK726]|uniref:Uncharacterized protein n=1 Tax=Clonostachys rosea f. rosea IK726 TaxID=1349383 RepID=A0ACA9TFA1_BIOOC|nr:unnamed protein product [Clonostachys rosea f. rosea IK726]
MSLYPGGSISDRTRQSGQPMWAGLRRFCRDTIGGSGGEVEWFQKAENIPLSSHVIPSHPWPASRGM